MSLLENDELNEVNASCLYRLDQPILKKRFALTFMLVL